MFDAQRTNKLPQLILILTSVLALILSGFILTLFKEIVTSKVASATVSTNTGFHDCFNDPYVTCRDY